jgi:type IV secretion system protein VirD4
MAGRTFSVEDIAILRPEEVRQMQERYALVLAENGKPIIARLARCIDGKAGRRILGDQRSRSTSSFAILVRNVGSGAVEGSSSRQASRGGHSRPHRDMFANRSAVSSQQ